MSTITPPNAAIVRSTRHLYCRARRDGYDNDGDLRFIGRTSSTFYGATLPADIGLFGLAVTTGLFFYELRGIQKCNALIDAAKHLEHELSPEIEGAFRSRPPATRGVGGETAALIIYPTVAAGWAYMSTLTIGHTISSVPWAISAAIVVGLVAAALWASGGRRVLKAGQDLSEVRKLNRTSFLAEDRPADGRK